MRKTIHFYKYQGTGNDFVIIDQRNHVFDLTKEEIALLCHRRFGIGADGLMYLRDHPKYDFEMIYYNSDGMPSTMCGNGGRCISHLYHKMMQHQQSKILFTAVDGLHAVKILDQNIVSLQMGKVVNPEVKDQAYVLDTGSPHYVLPVDNVDNIHVKERGAAIRYSHEYKKEGINVNFMELGKEGIKVRTYERGVEDETLSCGTGVTAAAISADQVTKNKYGNIITVYTMGGTLQVSFERSKEGYDNVWLTGPAKEVFQGHISLDQLTR